MRSEVYLPPAYRAGLRSASRKVNRLADSAIDASARFILCIGGFGAIAGFALCIAALGAAS